MTVSIIIAVKTWQKNLEECVDNCLRLDYPDFEIIILPDETSKRDYLQNPSLPIRIFPTGAVSPAIKRDIAIKYAKGEILAFIDDDAYPAKNWLKAALENFKDRAIAAVGGPAVTPKEDTPRQQASGIVYQSILVTAGYNYRYMAKKKREVDDYPSCNFLVRKSVMQELGGFNTKFWPGEDTKLCLDISAKLGKKIIYDPEVLIYHHRRALFWPHLKQVANYALHRGYFAKVYPKTSLKLAYFMPTLFLFALLGGAVLSLSSSFIKMLFFIGLLLYLVLILFSIIGKDLRFLPLVFLGIILTHITYGYYFLKGFFSKKLKEEL